MKSCRKAFGVPHSIKKHATATTEKFEITVVIAAHLLLSAAQGTPHGRFHPGYSRDLSFLRQVSIMVGIFRCP